MKVYILGAGVSKTVGYPLGSELFDEIDGYVRGSGNMFDRFNYREWDTLKTWLSTSSDPAVAQAYRTKNIEHLFTAFDLVSTIRNEALLATARTDRGSAQRSAAG